MGLIERVYKTESDSSIWEISPFWFFNPDVKTLSHKSVRVPISENDSQYFIDQIRSDFCPGMGNKETEEHLMNSINRGIRSINILCKEHLGKDSSYFDMEEFRWFDSFTLFSEARRDYISSRNGFHPPKRDHELFFKAYKFARSWGLGRMVLTIDTSPEVLSSLRHGELIQDWFNQVFSFRKQKPSGVEDLPFLWKTNLSGINVYGSETPIRCRIKILDEKNNLKYGSILMKMFEKRRFMDSMKDQYGTEFIVEDDEAREELLRYFRGRRGGGGHLEAFKSSGEGGSKKRSASSRKDFDSTKFILRPPIKVPDVLPFTCDVFERIPIEVQILTLEGHRARIENPDLTHEAYKKRQFESVFPLWFPRGVYEPLLKNVG